MIRDAEIRRLARMAGVHGWNRARTSPRYHSERSAGIRPGVASTVSPFSDADDLGTIQLRCYALAEVMSEKVRAVLGQRIYAVSRDLYDIYSLLKHVEEQKVQASLPRKLAARGVDLEAIHLHRVTGRKDEFQADWARNLDTLLPPGAEEEFDDVWNAVAEYVGRIATAVP